MIKALEGPKVFGSVRLLKAEIDEILKVYQPEWVDMNSALVDEKSAIGSFNYAPPNYIRPEVLGGFEYLTAPLLLMNSFQLAIIYAHQNGKLGGIEQHSFSDQDVESKLLSGALKISKVTNIRFRSATYSTDESHSYDLFLTVNRIFSVNSKLFISVSVKDCTNSMACDFVATVDMSC